MSTDHGYSSISSTFYVDQLVLAVEQEQLKDVLIALRQLPPYDINTRGSSGCHMTALEALFARDNDASDASEEPNTALRTLILDILLLSGASTSALDQSLQVELGSLSDIENGGQDRVIVARDLLSMTEDEVDAWIAQTCEQEAAEQRRYEKELAAWTAARADGDVSRGGYIGTDASNSISPLRRSSAEDSGEEIVVSQSSEDSHPRPRPALPPQQDIAPVESFRRFEYHSRADARPPIPSRTNAIRLEQVPEFATSDDVRAFVSAEISLDLVWRTASATARVMNRCDVVYLAGSVDALNLASKLDGRKMFGTPIHVEVPQPVLYVGNLPLDVATEELQRIMRRHGVDIPSHSFDFEHRPAYGHSSTHAFITTESLEEAMLLIRAADQELAFPGRNIAVRWRTTSKPRDTSYRHEFLEIALDVEVVIHNLPSGTTSKRAVASLCCRAVGCDPVDVHMPSQHQRGDHSATAHVTVAARSDRQRLVEALNGASYEGRILTARLEPRCDQISSGGNPSWVRPDRDRYALSSQPERGSRTRGRNFLPSPPASQYDDRYASVPPSSLQDDRYASTEAYSHTLSPERRFAPSPPPSRGSFRSHSPDHHRSDRARVRPSERSARRRDRGRLHTSTSARSSAPGEAASVARWERGRSVSPIRPARYASPWPEVFPTLPHSLPPTQHYSTLFSQSNLPPQTLLLANLPPALVGTDVLDLLGSKLRPYIEQIAFNLVGLDQMDARVVLRGRTRAAIDELARALDRCQVLDRRIRSSVE